jgi:hypothetical protein
LEKDIDAPLLFISLYTFNPNGGGLRGATVAACEVSTWWWASGRACHALGSYAARRVPEQWRSGSRSKGRCSSCSRFGNVPPICRILPVWQNHLRNEGFIDQDQIGQFSAKREYNEHTISIQYHIFRVKYSYYTLSLSIGYTKGLKPKHASKDDLVFAEAISLNV